MANSALKVSKVPSAFAPIGAKHNALVDLVKGMQGVGGVTVKTSDGKILISATGTGTSSEGDPINVVGSDGKLNLVPKHSTWVTPTTYPTELTVVNGAITASLDSGGIVVENATDAIYVGPAAISYIGSGVWHLNPNGFDYSSGSIAATVGYSGIAWEDAASSSLIDGNGFTFAGAVASLTLGDDGLLVDGGKVRVEDGSYAAQVATAGILYSAPAVTALIDSGGYFFRNASITTDAGAGGYFLTDGTTSATLGVFGLQIDGAGGTITVNDDGLVWDDSTYKAYIDFEGFTFFGASATGQLGNGFLRLESTTLSVTYGVDALEFDNGAELTQISATGFFYDSGSVTGYFGNDGIYWAYGTTVISLDDTAIEFSGPNGVATISDGEILWGDSTHSAYIDIDGFTFYSASATGQLGNGFLHLASSTLSVTYGVSSLNFISGDDRTQTSATGFNYDYLSGTIQADFGEDGIYWAYSGTVISADDNAIVFQVGSTTATLYESALVFDSSTVATTYSRDFIEFDNGYETTFISATGYRYGDFGTVTGSFGGDGLFWQYAGATITADDNGIVYRNASLTHTLGPTGVIADFGTNKVRIESTTFLISGASASISIAYASISVQISLTAIDVCSNGTPKKMLILGSAPY